MYALVHVVHIIFMTVIKALLAYDHEWFYYTKATKCCVLSWKTVRMLLENCEYKNGMNVMEKHLLLAYLRAQELCRRIDY